MSPHGEIKALMKLAEINLDGGELIGAIWRLGQAVEKLERLHVLRSEALLEQNTTRT